MRIAPPSRLMMVARTDKEVRLKEFISEALINRADDPELREPVTLIVRDVDSPAATALNSVLAEGWSYVPAVRVIVFDKRVDASAASSLFDAEKAEFRHLIDRRFGAAHEQLVVGKARVWIGDCLRRDPAKRDAFEIYHPADPATRVTAAASFERLWNVAKPMRAGKPVSLAPEILPVTQVLESLPPRNGLA